MGLPQLITMSLMLFVLACGWIFNGKQFEVKFEHKLIDFVVWLFLLSWGGFFNA